MALCALVLLTGAMHEDGLADTADGLGGGHTRDQSLAIMKDSRVGSFGVIALMLSMILRWSALWLLAGSPVVALVLVATLSRAVLPAQMALIPHARQDGLAHMVGQAQIFHAFCALAIAATIGLLMAGWGAFLLLPVAYLAVLPLSFLALQKIGGQTGDILGASQQVAEIAVLIALTTLL